MNISSLIISITGDKYNLYYILIKFVVVGIFIINAIGVLAVFKFTFTYSRYMLLCEYMAYFPTCQSLFA